MARVREDERFKAVGPETPVIAPGLGLEDEPQEDGEGSKGEGDVWLDWGFVEFWKGNACESIVHFERCGAADE